MSDVQNTVVLAMAEAEVAIEGITDLTERLKVAIRTTVNHWMEVRDEYRLQAAIAATYAKSSKEERQILDASILPMKAMSSARQGVPINWDMIKRQQEPFKGRLINIRGLWEEIEKETKI